MENGSIVIERGRRKAQDQERSERSLSSLSWQRNRGRGSNLTKKQQPSPQDDRGGSKRLHQGSKRLRQGFKRLRQGFKAMY